MLAYVLVACGAVVVVGTVVTALRTRQRPDAEPKLDPSDPWAVFTPRTEEDIEREAHVRLWPVAAGLSGLVLIMGGLVNAEMNRPGRLIAPSPETFAIDVGPTAVPSAEPTPTPEPSVEPAEATSTPGVTARAATPRPAPTRTPARKATPRPTPRPTPTPVPRKPGPSVGASTSCFGNALNISYSASARDGTKLSSLRVSLDGTTVQTPNVSGKSQYAASYSTSARSGSHTFVVSATGSDGGTTSRSFSVKCP